jgi:hypothetical protein
MIIWKDGKVREVPALVARHVSLPQDRVAQLYAVATLEQPRRFHPIRPGCESRQRLA